MSLAYVNKTYGTAFKRGMQVSYIGHPKACTYRVLSASAHVFARFDYTGQRYVFHPNDLKPTIPCDCVLSGVENCPDCKGAKFHPVSWAEHRAYEKMKRQSKKASAA